MSTKTDIYGDVTDKIIAMLEAGTPPWSRPWSAAGGSGRPLRGNGKPYQGVNVLQLWATSMDQGYASDTWLTYKQAQGLGAQVRKGEEGTTVIYYGSFERENKDANGIAKDNETIPFMKGYSVFNLEQIDNLPDSYKATPTVRTEHERHATLENFVALTNAEIKEEGSRACYIPGLDAIRMPKLSTFEDRDSYYSTLAHELTHWTGAKHRLARDLSVKFKSESYAVEELVAELGAAFLMADFGVSATPRLDHASYIQSWLKVLKADKKAIFTAASQASKASSYLLKLTGYDAIIYPDNDTDLEQAA